MAHLARRLDHDAGGIDPGGQGALAGEIGKGGADVIGEDRVEIHAWLRRRRLPAR